MKTFTYSTLLLITSLILFGCTKVDQRPLFEKNYWECHNEQSWDKSKIRKALIGEWRWEYIINPWSSKIDNTTFHSGLKIRFNSDSTAVVMKNGAVVKNAVWAINTLDTYGYTVETTPYITETFGTILFCEDRVLFNSSYADGDDNYFKRVK